MEKRKPLEAAAPFFSLQKNKNKKNQKKVERPPRGGLHFHIFISPEFFAQARGHQYLRFPLFFDNFAQKLPILAKKVIWFFCDFFVW